MNLGADFANNGQDGAGSIQYLYSDDLNLMNLKKDKTPKYQMPADYVYPREAYSAPKPITGPNVYNGVKIIAEVRNPTNGPAVSNMGANLPGANNLVTKRGVVPVNQALAGAEYVALYFTGSFCGPCKAFTPVLSQFYNTVNRNGKKIEIVTIPADSNESAARQYQASMPWISAEFKDKSRIQKFHGVTGIPKLMIFKRDGSLVNANAVAGIKGAQQTGKQADFINRLR